MLCMETCLSSLWHIFLCFIMDTCLSSLWHIFLCFIKDTCLSSLGHVFLFFAWRRVSGLSCFFSYASYVFFFIESYPSRSRLCWVRFWNDCFTQLFRFTSNERQFLGQPSVDKDPELREGQSTCSLISQPEVPTAAWGGLSWHSEQPLRFIGSDSPEQAVMIHWICTVSPTDYFLVGYRWLYP